MKLKIFLFIALLAISTFDIPAQNAKSKTVPIAVGTTAPDFTLNDQNGKAVTLSKLKKPVVLVFYRGYW
jgi:cytochrome oxidase Cu insertion factor (SCO1/SenC/PrrC family)